MMKLVVDVLVLKTYFAGGLLVAATSDVLVPVVALRVAAGHVAGLRRQISGDRV